MAVRKEVKLLVVDDHSDQFDHILCITEMYNSEYRIECKLATTQREAKSLMSSWQPSVILVDLHLGAADSLPLMDYIAETGCAPVVAMSDSRSADLEQTAEVHGAIAFVPKGDDQEEVEALVDYLASVAQDSSAEH